MPVDAPLYPVGLVVAGRPVLVVGGGRVAARKVADLVACGARVTVVAPEVAPALAGQGDVADRLVAAGVTSILNFAPAVLSVPDHVSLRKVDLSIELQILSFYQQRRSGAVPERADDLHGVAEQAASA